MAKPLILIDIRPLLSGRGGVPEYTQLLVEALLREHQELDYILFANSWREVKLDFNVPPETKIAITRWPNKLFNFSSRFLNWPKVDKLYSPNRRPDLIMALNVDFLAWSRGIKLLLTVHDLSFELLPNTFSFKDRFWQRLTNSKMMSRRATHLVAVSENTKQDIVDIYDIPQEKITRVYPGLSDDYLRPEESLSNSDSKIEWPERFILAFAHHGRKNTLGLLTAWESGKKRGELADYKLALVGQSKSGLGVALCRAIERLGLQNDIIWLENIDRRTLRQAYERAIALAYPSFYEGFGMPPLEAAALGTRSILSCNSSLLELAPPSTLWVDPYNRASLERALILAASDGKLDESKRQKLKDFSAKFTWSRAALEVASLASRLTKV